MMITLTFLNQKGGVGKTSLCHHLAGTLARQHRRVLLVDNDPQASLTQGWFGPEKTEGFDPRHTVAGIYDGRSFVKQTITPTGLPGVAIMAGSWLLADFNIARPEDQVLELRCGLARALAEVAGDYEVCLIDCPPNLNLCSYAALVAADALVVPLQAEDYGSQGLLPVRDFLLRVRSCEPTAAIDLLGYLITMFDARPSLPRLYEGALREAYGEAVFRNLVPRSIDFPEAVARRVTVSQLRPRGKAAASMAAIAGEIEDRLAARVERPALSLRRA